MNAWFTSNEVLFQTILVYSLLAFSIQIALRAGVFSLAGVGCWAIGGYVVAILTLRGVNLLLAILAALVLAGAVTWCLSKILVRLRGLYLGMATMAFDLMVGVAVLNGGDLTGGATGLYGISASVSLGALAVVVAVVATLLAAFEGRALGRAYEVVREDEDLASSLGVNANKARHAAFVLSGVVGALGGALNAVVIGTVSPVDSGFPVVVLALTMVIVGGYSSWRGAFIGTALIQYLPIGIQSVGLSFISEWWSAIYGGLIVFIAVYAPRGLLGVASHIRLRLMDWKGMYTHQRPVPEPEAPNPMPKTMTGTRS